MDVSLVPNPKVIETTLRLSAQVDFRRIVHWSHPKSNFLDAQHKRDPSTMSRLAAILLTVTLATSSAISAPRFAGGISFASAGNLVTYTVDEIYNDSVLFSTGSIQVAVYGTWAPYLGSGLIFGTDLYIGYLDPLFPNFAYYNLSGTVPFTDSPTNYTYLVVILREWNGFQYVRTDYMNIPVSRFFPTFFASPSIATQPQSQAVSVGQNVTISVSATGSGTLTYQWKRNGSNISGATSSSYTITDVTSSHAGSYTVMVSNLAGDVTSAAATLTVNSAFQTWRDQQFTAQQLLDDSISGQNADPDFDVYSNLLEYALGLNPLAQSFSEFPVLTVSENGCVFTYKRPANRRELTYSVEGSTTLVPSSWSADDVTNERITQGNEETWQATYQGSSGVFFMRLRVAISAP